MPVRDYNLDVSPSTVPLIANGNSLAKEIRGTPINGLAVQVNVMATSVSTVPTLTVYVRGDSSTAPTTDSPILGQSSAILVAGEYIVPFVGVGKNAHSVLVEYVLTGAATDSPNFSDVEAYIVENVGAPWSRLVDFS